MGSQVFLEHDKVKTLTNRDNLFKNKNLLYWYENLFRAQFFGINELEKKVILEIGSGTSPLHFFYKNVITSDIMDLPYLEHRFDCHFIDIYEKIFDRSVDIVTMTNVLHHVQDPILCLKKIAVKLRSGGCVIIAEPFCSFLSTMVFKCFHHEPLQFKIDRPVLNDIKGPLSSANMALPYMIFFSDKGWDKQLENTYTFSKENVDYFSSLSYMLTGGISRRTPIPGWLYKKIFFLDHYLSRKFPRLFSAFFIIKLIKK